MGDSTGIHHFMLGSFECTIFRESDETRPTDAGHWLKFVNANDDEVMATHRAYSQATGDPAADVSMNVLLVDTGDHRVLVDTGCGPNPSRKGAGNLLNLLDSAGMSTADVDIVVITHGHWDHIEGNTDGQGNPTYPNARYVISDVEWDNLTRDPSEIVNAQLLSIADRFERVAMDAEIVPGIRAVPAPGHTLGQIGLLIESNGERLLQSADAFHHPVELYRPEWYFSFDADPVATVSTRRRLFEMATRENLLVLPYHFPFPGLGRIETDGDRWTWRVLRG